jgi:hypothetical protein
MALPASLQVALKEWDTVCRALQLGRQMILLRKGGIREAGAGFELEYREFLLFPTFVHQNRPSLKASAHAEFSPASQEPSQVTISAAGSVSDIIELKSRAQMEAIDDEHVWEKPLIAMRFNYKPENPLYLLLVRAYRLPEPVAMENTPVYAGCKSWVPLAQAVSTGDATAVLDDVRYEQRRKSVLERVTAARP